MNNSDQTVDEFYLDESKVDACVRQVALAHMASAEVASPHGTKTADASVIQAIIEAGVRPEQADQALKVIVDGFEQGVIDKVESRTAGKARGSAAPGRRTGGSRLYSAAYDYGWKVDEAPHARQAEQAQKLKVLAIVSAFLLIATIISSLIPR